MSLTDLGSAVRDPKFVVTMSGWVQITLDEATGDMDRRSISYT